MYNKHSLSKSSLAGVFALMISTGIATLGGIGCSDGATPTPVYCVGANVTGFSGSSCGPAVPTPNGSPPPLPPDPGFSAITVATTAADDGNTLAKASNRAIAELNADRANSGQSGGVYTPFVSAALSGGDSPGLPQAISKKPVSSGGPDLTLNLAPDSSTKTRVGGTGTSNAPGGAAPIDATKGNEKNIAMNPTALEETAHDGKSAYASGGGGGAKPPGGSGDSASGSGWGGGGGTGATNDAVAALSFDPEKADGNIDPMGSADPEDYFVRLGLEENLFKTVSKRILKKSAQWVIEKPAVKTKKN